MLNINEDIAHQKVRLTTSSAIAVFTVVLSVLVPSMLHWVTYVYQGKMYENICIIDRWNHEGRNHGLQDGGGWCHAQSFMIRYISVNIRPRDLAF